MNLEKKIEQYVDISVRGKKIIGLVFIFLRRIGLTRFVRKIWVRKAFRQSFKKPSVLMIETKEFFKSHENDVNFNLSLLSDEASKNIYKNIIKFRCTHDLKCFPEYNDKNQYFVKDIVPKRNDYVFVDGGAYTGDTVMQFLSFCDMKFKKIVCFEPDPENINALQKNCEGIKDIEIIKKGMWSETTTLSFFQDQSASKISEIGEVKIDVTSIDKEEVCSDANFLKMDIEGAELMALEGAKNTIKRNCPVLAICIYHSNEDMIEILKWINDLGLDYKYYIRHHSFDVHDTVLYAIPKN